jgi:hypothetical protein
VFAPWSRQPRQAARYAATLRTEHGAVAGWIVLKPDELTLETGLLLDLYVHPAFVDDAPKLGAGVPWPDTGRVTAYTSRPGGYRAAFFERAGLRPAAVLPGWIEGQGRSFDLHAFSR